MKLKLYVLKDPWESKYAWSFRVEEARFFNSNRLIRKIEGFCTREDATRAGHIFFAEYAQYVLDARKEIARISL